VKISIFGMGYVGVVSASCLLRDGHDITGVDLVPSKVDDLNNGRSPISEPGVAELLADGHKAGRLRATTDPSAALDGCEMVWICVGTPSNADGSVNVDAVQAAMSQIGAYIQSVADRPLIVIRSTSIPGSTRTRMIPALEKAGGLTVGQDVHVVFHPEFLREGSAVDDFVQPPKIVVGEAHPGAGDRLNSIYESYSAPRFRLELEEAEMVKYCDNLFHAVKITFANECGAVARAAGIDARRVAEVFCADTKLNISPRYLRPGFAFGGSCLPKDLRAILRRAAMQSVRTPMLSGVMESNEMQIDAFVNRVLSNRPRTVGMVGLAFKSDTDDMRESPYVAVAKRLIGEGVQLRIYDPGVHPDRLTGSNKSAVQSALRHLETLLVSSLDELDGCDAVLINHGIVDAQRVGAWTSGGVRVFDLVSIPDVDRNTQNYEGIAW